MHAAPGWPPSSTTTMAINRHAADEEARAEVDVLTSRLEKTTQLTKKIQASLARLKTSGRSVENAIGPIYDNTQRLQVLGKSMSSIILRLRVVNLVDIDGVIGAIGKIRQPSDIKNNEEDIIRAGYAREIPHSPHLLISTVPNQLVFPHT
jgi:exocyst complex protein 7